MSMPFIERIALQRVFTSPVVCGNEKSTLVCRNNTELFYAVGNVLRYTTIQDKTSGYKILLFKDSDFIIKSLVLNQQGNFLALVGDNTLVVLFLPANLPSITRGVSKYELKGYKVSITSSVLSFPIKKVLWQPNVYKDSSLVVLTGNSIVLCFDMVVSHTTPQSVYNLANRPEFAQQVAETMTFGSLGLLLAGCLTLYVISKTGNIYALYPFICKSAGLLAHRKQVNQLYYETKALKDRTLGDFLQQSEFAEELHSIISNPITSKRHNLGYHITSPFLEEIQCQLQGPLYRHDFSDSNLRLSDIEMLTLDGPLTSDVPIIATSITDAQKKLHISVYAQYQPLSMKWAAKNDSSETKAKPETNSASGYSKLRRGFGYLDEDDESGINTPTAPSKLIKVYNANVSQNSQKTDLVKFPGETHNFLVSVPGRNILLFDCDELIQKISRGEISSLDNCVKHSELASVTLYGGSAFIKDTITEEGTFLVNIDGTRKVHITKVKEGLTFSKLDESEKKQQPVVKKNQQLAEKENILKSIGDKDIPFAELEAQLATINTKFASEPLTQHLKETASDLEVELDTNIDPKDQRYLTLINSLSLKTVEYVSDYTQYAIGLKARLSNQLDLVRSHVEQLNEVKKFYDAQGGTVNEESEASEASEDELSAVEQKQLVSTTSESEIYRLAVRQARLDERLNSLNERTFNAIQHLKLEAQLPLSKAEIKWFKEINNITDLVGGDLKNSIKDREQQVKKLRDELSIDRLTLELNSLKLSQKVSKVKNWLDQEGQLIQITLLRMQQLKKQAESIEITQS